MFARYHWLQNVSCVYSLRFNFRYFNNCIEIWKNAEDKFLTSCMQYTVPISYFCAPTSFQLSIYFVAKILERFRFWSETDVNIQFTTSPCIVVLWCYMWEYQSRVVLYLQAVCILIVSSIVRED